MDSKILIFFIACMTILFSSCKSKKVDNNEIINSTQKITDKIYNPNKSMVLILNYSKTKNPIITYNYKVIDVEAKQELKKGFFTGKKIEWLNNDTIKCTPYVGMIKKERDQVLEKNQDQKIKYITIKIN